MEETTSMIVCTAATPTMVVQVGVTGSTETTWGNFRREIAKEWYRKLALRLEANEKSKLGWRPRTERLRHQVHDRRIAIAPKARSAC